MAHDPGLETAVTALAAALEAGDLADFFGAILPDAVIMDEDLPFRVDRTGFQARIAFHGPGIWKGFAWKPSGLRYVPSGGSGAAMGFAMFRGKPRGSGYRLRPMLFSRGWTKLAGRWKLASWQQSPIIGHVTRPSPA